MTFQHDQRLRYIFNFSFGQAGIDTLPQGELFFYGFNKICV